MIGSASSSLFNEVLPKPVQHHLLVLVLDLLQSFSLIMVIWFYPLPLPHLHHLLKTYTHQMFIFSPAFSCVQLCRPTEARKLIGRCLIVLRVQWSAAGLFLDRGAFGNIICSAQRLIMVFTQRSEVNTRMAVAIWLYRPGFIFLSVLLLWYEVGWEGLVVLEWIRMWRVGVEGEVVLGNEGLLEFGFEVDVLIG